MKKALLILFFCVFQCYSNAIPDSIGLKLKSGSAIEKADAYNRLSFTVLYVEKEKSFNYAHKALSISDKENYLVGKAEALFNIGRVYALSNSNTLAAEYFMQSLNIYKKIRQDKNIRVNSDFYADLMLRQELMTKTSESHNLITEKELEVMTKSHKNMLIILLISAIVIVPLLIIILLNYISKRKRAIGLTEQNQFLQTLLDSIPNPIFYKNLNFSFVGCNSELEKMLGKKKEEIIGKNAADFYNVDIADKMNQIDGVCLKSGSIQQYDASLTFADGKIHETLITKTAFRDNKGKVEGLIGIIIDITKIRELENQIKIKEEYYRLMFENAPVGILLADNEGNIIDVNPALLTIIGSPSQEETKKINLLTFSLLIQSGFSEKFRLCLDSGKPVVAELYYKSAWGKEAFLHINLNPYHSNNGIIERIQLMVLDISEIKIAEQKLQLLIEELQNSNLKISSYAEELQSANARLLDSEAHLKDANATKDKFFSIISHDLKNPFNVLLNYSNLLSQSYQDFTEREKVELINDMKHSIESTLRLVDNLLQWSRSQTGVLKHNPDILMLKEIAVTNLYMAKTAAKSKGINLDLDVNDEHLVFADQNIVTTVMRNLISNALKFTPSGGTITVLSHESGDFVEVEIRDTGVGISDKDKEKLFRIDVHHTKIGTNKEMGTGLGLILCKEFIEKSGGRIWVESRLGKGTSFKFTLPKAEL